MAQILTAPFVTTAVPGSYPNVTAQTQPVGISSSGIIAIIGEADGGDDYSQEALKDNFFGPNQVAEVTRKYVSGNIVDAMRMLAASSSDADISGAPTRIYIAKTNASTKASATLATSYADLEAKVAGADGNKLKYEITHVDSEEAPELEGATIANFAALAGVEFAVRVNGGVSTTIDVFNGALIDFDTIAEVVALIDAALPAGISCVLGTASDSLKLVVDADANAHTKGWGKSFELIEITPAGLAALGLSEDLFTSALEPKAQIDIKRADINLNESFLAEAAVAFQIGYEGTTATMTINATSLTTTVAGGSGANLSLQLSQFATLKDMADYISSQTGYTAQAVAASAQLPTSALDKVAAIGICSTSSEMPGRVKKSIYNFEKALTSSQAVNFDTAATAGLPDETAIPIFLSGGAKGSTTAASVIAAIDALEGINVNFVLPLFSRDASEDIVDGLTESASTYTISAVNAAVKNHCLKMSTAKLKKNRTAYLSFWNDSYEDAKDEAASLSHYRISLAFQKVNQVNAFGAVKSYFPWMTAAVAAGMQAAGFYKSITNKFANVISFEDPSGYDSGNPDQQEDAILSGLLALRQEVAGNPWLLAQTTHTIDNSFLYNSSQLVYLSDLFSLNLAADLQRTFVGKSLADADAQTVIGYIVSKMAQFKQQKVTVASDDTPTGFKNLKVQVRGSVINVAIEVKLNGSILFIPIDILLSEANSEATA